MAGSKQELAKLIANNPEAEYYLERVSESMYFNYRPRPDQPERYDEIESFVEAKDALSILSGGNGSGTTEAGTYKMCKFLLREQAPPRLNCPFWIVGSSKEEVMEAIWCEKIVGSGHIPESEIDWDNISWENAKKNWPSSVPLKPWPGRPGKNWRLEFKSYEQGRDKFQARNIGGFFFTEQFPWEILEECYRGMRVYNFRGGKFCEFTPIDPSLTVKLQDMYERDMLPPNWRLYRSNTLCNVEDPNSPVGMDWYEEFFGLISEEMKETRLTGAFAGFEGGIYKFNRRVHLFEGTVDPPVGVFHRRGVDWGAGTDNAFVFLWGFQDSTGQWVIYDEYYSKDQGLLWEDHARNIHAKDGWYLHNQDGEFSLIPIRDLKPGTKAGQYLCKGRPVYLNAFQESCINNHVRWRYGDPHFLQTFAPPDRPDLFREFNKYKCQVSAANAGPGSVYEGIEAVRFALQVRKSTGDPGLIISYDMCPNTAREMHAYRWKARAQRGTNPEDAKPVPLKKDDHTCDALRYMIYSSNDHSTMKGDYIPPKRREQFKRMSRVRGSKEFIRGA